MTIERSRSPGPPFAIAAAVACVLLIPLALVRMPPLIDYPNHLARMWLIAGGIHSPPFTTIYQLDWRGASTNITDDLAAAVVGPLLGADLVGRILVALAIVLPPLGAAALNRSVFGAWNPWQIGFAFTAWSTTLLAGFLNFQIGLGLALLLASFDGALKARGRLASAAWRFVCAYLLCVNHLFSLVFYAALLCGLEVGADSSPGRSGRAFLGVLAGTALALIPCAAALGLIMVLAPALPGSQTMYGGTIWSSGLHEHMRSLSSAIRTYDLRLDALMLALLVAPLIAFLARRRLRTHFGLIVTFIGLVCLAWLMPQVLAGTAWIDRRLPIMALLTGLAAVQPDLRGDRKTAIALAAFLGVLVMLRTTWIGWIWMEAQSDFRAVEASLGGVPQGAAVLPLMRTPVDAQTRQASSGRFIYGDEDSFRHYPAMAIPLRHAFEPMLFAARGKQPIRVVPPWNEIAVPEGVLADVNALRNPKLIPATAPYVRLWRTRFDYLLVMNADSRDRFGDAPPPAPARLISDHGFAKLYRIDH